MRRRGIRNSSSCPSRRLRRPGGPLASARMTRLPLLAFLALSSVALAADDGWISLFDGKSLDNWKASDKPGTFSVADGQIVVHGDRSHLFYDGPKHDFTNF